MVGSGLEVDVGLGLDMFGCVCEIDKRRRGVLGIEDGKVSEEVLDVVEWGDCADMAGCFH